MKRGRGRPPASAEKDDGVIDDDAKGNNNNADADSNSNSPTSPRSHPPAGKRPRIYESPPRNTDAPPRQWDPLSSVLDGVYQQHAKSHDGSQHHQPEGRQNESSSKWRAHQMAEDYVNMASNLLLPSARQDCCLPRQQLSSTVTAYGYLLGSFRKPTIIERWSPYEICLFEACIGRLGKEFYEIHKIIKTKSCKEVIDFYYIWKKTSHYRQWKDTYVPPHEDVSSDEDDNDNDNPNNA